MQRLLLIAVLLLTACRPAPRLSPFSDLPQPPFDVTTAPSPSPADAVAMRSFIAAGLAADAGENEQAAAALEQSIVADSSSVALRLKLAELRLRMGDEDGAVRAAEDALIQDNHSLQAALFLGNLYFNKGDSQRACSYYEQAMIIAPEKEDIVLHLAIAAARSGDYPRAVEVLKGLIRQHPDLYIAELALARLYRDMNLPALAEETLNGLMKRQPQLDAPYIELAAISESRGENDKAVGYLRNALAVKPENLAVRHQLARLLIISGALDKAQFELDEIVRRNPDDLEARRKTGLIFLEQKRWDEAIRSFTTILASDPDLEQVRFYLATAHERKGDFAAALTAFEAISADSDLYEDALAHRAYLLHQQERNQHAVELLEDYLAHGKGRATLYLYLASLYESSEDYPRARATFERAQTLFPNESEVGYKTGLFLDRRGERSAAIACMRGVLKQEPDHVEALNFIAYAFAEAGENLDEALTLAKRALELKPQGHIRDTLGWVYFRRGDLVKARDLLEAAAAQLNDDPVVIEHLGDVFHALGQNPKAAEFYQRSLDLMPQNPTLIRKLKQLNAPKETP